MLSPYRVLDLTDFRGEIGPMILGDMGADVIRIEPPTGSSARSCAPLKDLVAPTILFEYKINTLHHIWHSAITYQFLCVSQLFLPIPSITRHHDNYIEY